MLLKLASMFLTNIFYYTKVIFKIKKRDTRLFHFWIILYKLYHIYFKVDSSLANTKLRHSANKISETLFLAGVPTPKYYSYYTWLVYPISLLIQLCRWGCSYFLLILLNLSFQFLLY